MGAGGALVLWSEADHLALDTATEEPITRAGDTAEGVLPIEGTAAGVYSRGSTVVAGDADCS